MGLRVAIFIASIPVLTLVPTQVFMAHYVYVSQKVDSGYATELDCHSTRSH
jgi:hypothetical protein